MWRFINSCGGILFSLCPAVRRSGSLWGGEWRREERGDNGITASRTRSGKLLLTIWVLRCNGGLTGPHSRIYNGIVWDTNFADRAIIAACLAVWASALIIMIVDWGRKQWKEQELGLGEDQKEDSDSLNMKINNIFFFFFKKGWKHRIGVAGGGRKKSSSKSKIKGQVWKEIKAQDTHW